MSVPPAFPRGGARLNAVRDKKMMIENRILPDLTPLEVQVSGGRPSNPQREIGTIFGCARWGVSGAL